MEPLQVTIDGAARLLSVSRRQVEELIYGEAPALPSHLLGRRRYIRTADLRRYVASLSPRPHDTARTVEGSVAGQIDAISGKVVRFQRGR